MWEEPRPERLRRLGDDRKRQLRQSIIAYAIILAAAAVVIKAVMVDWAAKNKTEPPVAPSLQPHATPATPATVPQRPQASGSLVPEPAVPSRVQRQPLTNTARGDPNVMRNLVETCTYWTQQNTRGQYAGNQEMACRDMVAYGRDHGFNVPQVTLLRPGPTSGALSGTTGADPQIRVDECTRHTYGSIDYRRCRAAEKSRLVSTCQRLRNELETAQGSRRADLLAQTSATCSIADLYRIVQ